MTYTAAELGQIKTAAQKRLALLTGKHRKALIANGVLKEMPRRQSPVKWDIDTDGLVNKLTDELKASPVDDQGQFDNAFTLERLVYNVLGLPQDAEAEALPSLEEDRAGLKSPFNGISEIVRNKLSTSAKGRVQQQLTDSGLWLIARIPADRKDMLKDSRWAVTTNPDLIDRWWLAEAVDKRASATAKMIRNEATLVERVGDLDVAARVLAGHLADAQAFSLASSTLRDRVLVGMDAQAIEAFDAQVAQHQSTYVSALTKQFTMIGQAEVYRPKQLELDLTPESATAAA